MGNQTQMAAQNAPRTALTIVENLRRNAARKSELDADKVTMTNAANAIELLLSVCQDCMDDRGDWGRRMSQAMKTIGAAS